MSDVGQAFSELHRVLEERGVLAICFTLRKYLEDREFVRHGLRLYEEDDVQNLLASAGFADVRVINGVDRHREFACAVGRK
ncbi:MAG: hypothetical protein JXQ73_32950 [Phycisphaerae bacterium]|nr:hypothetical protein [Phycisphaerae bacterium]